MAKFTHLFMQTGCLKIHKPIIIKATLTHILTSSWTAWQNSYNLHKSQEVSIPYVNLKVNGLFITHTNVRTA
ncbi:hypothetical protein [Alysiella crassa]|uniref:hypothetical protein n=1 Tax=Alysiella crassa TaxID=153491 RepID=UPI001FD571B7|nr:hypothetical protein [Alysiella crassa]UOP08308.1 hypothetical protein LVJ80_13660 [Alysiella crassa]